MKTRLIAFLLIGLVTYSCANDQKEVSVKSMEEQSDTVQPKESVPESQELNVRKSNFRILPVDESSSDPSLKQFVAKLKEIVRKKDLQAFTACLDTGIIVSYGGGMSGINDFRSEWKLDKHPEKSELWSRMKRYLDLGGAWENKNEFRIPYAQCNRFFSHIDENELDWYFTAVCVSPKTAVYQKPDLQSPKTALLSYEIVRIVNRQDDFIEIQTLDKNVSGFVHSKQIVVSAEAFPGLQKIDGTWKITSFAPYD